MSACCAECRVKNNPSRLGKASICLNKVSIANMDKTTLLASLTVTITGHFLYRSGGIGSGSLTTQHMYGVVLQP